MAGRFYHMLTSNRFIPDWAGAALLVVSSAMAAGSLILQLYMRPDPASLSLLFFLVYPIWVLLIAICDTLGALILAPIISGSTTNKFLRLLSVGLLPVHLTLLLKLARTWG